MVLSVTLTGALLFLAHAAIIVGLSLRIIPRRLPVGTALAWIILLIIAPLLGAALYLFFGENRLGRRRMTRTAVIRSKLKVFALSLESGEPEDWSALGPGAEPLHRLLRNTVGAPALCGNALELLSDAEAILRSIIRDIDGARSTCHMEFYIWNPGGTADEVAEALLRASGRGVTCKILLDSVGSSVFFKSPWPGKLREGGVEVVEALPAGLVRALFARVDLRLHRKIVVIDGEVAYTGSLNLVDPRHFKRDAGVGQWVDCMARVRGHVVRELQAIFAGDWAVESGGDFEALAREYATSPVPHPGCAVAQAAPSGPGFGREEILKLLLMTVYTARRELVLTTPYFVPDESLMTALTSASQRGVAVTIVVPEEVDSFLVRHASRSYFSDLIAAGVKVLCFRGGLLHSKTVTVDSEIALIGTVNLDMRSFRLNFEVTLFAYDREFCARLKALQETYIGQSTPIGEESWWNRRAPARLLDDTVRLFGPLL